MLVTDEHIGSMVIGGAGTFMPISTRFAKLRVA